MYLEKIVVVAVLSSLFVMCEGLEKNSTLHYQEQAVPNSIQSRLEAMQISIEELKMEIQTNVNAAKDVLREDIHAGVHSIKQEISGRTIRFPNPVFGNSGENGYYIQGHVEILHNNVWGTICDDYFDHNNNGANVLCKMDGYRFGSYDGGKYKQPSATKSSRIWLDDVTCSGSEADIEKCPHRSWGKNNCQHSEDVGIRCYY